MSTPAHRSDRPIPRTTLRAALLLGAALLAALPWLSTCCRKPGTGIEQAAPGLTATTSEAPPAPAPPAVDRHAMHFGLSGGLYVMRPDADFAREVARATRELDELGPVWLRSLGRGTAWFEIQPQRDQWRWERLDVFFEGNAHPLLVPIYGAKGTVYPFGSFADKDLGSLQDRRAVFEHLKQSEIDMTDAAQRQDAERYVKALVERYQDRARCWQIGNEGLGAANTLDVARYTFGWVHEVDPDAVVVCTAMAGDDDRMLDLDIGRFDRLMREGFGEYCDAFDLHYYGPGRLPIEEAIEERYEQVRSILDREGAGGKPIWVSETSTSSDPESEISGPSSESMQARHLVYRLVVLSAEGAQKVFWHNYEQPGTGNKFRGSNLVDPQAGRRKPAYYTFKLIVDEIGYFRQVETIRTAGARVYKFTNPDDSQVVVAWSHDNETLDVAAILDAPSVRVIHIVEDAETEPVVETMKSGALRLSPSPVLIEPAT